MKKIVVAIIVIAAGTARAQDAKKSAELLFEDGKRLLAAGNTAEACPKFEQSQKLDPAIGTLLNLGHCWELAGRVTSAWTAYLDAEALAKSKHDKRAKAAHDLAAGLAPKVPKVIVRAPSAPDGLAVTLDGKPVAASLLGAPVPVDPGAVVVAANAPGFEPFTKQLEVAAGATATVDVALTPVKTAEPPPKPIVTPPPPKPIVTTPPPPKPIAHVEARPHSSRKLLGLSVGGGGLVLAGGGAVVAILAKRDYDAQFTGSPPPCDRTTRRCTPAGYSATNDARSRANIGGAVAGVGVIALAVGAYLYVTAPDDTYVAPVVDDGAVGLVFGGSL